VGMPGGANMPTVPGVTVLPGIGKPIGYCELRVKPRGVPVGWPLLPSGKWPLEFASLLLGAMCAGSRT